jgi:hypothetical protein
MVSKTKLNLENLEALGAKRRAELLIEIADNDAATSAISRSASRMVLSRLRALISSS